MTIKSLHLEPEIQPDEEMIAKVTESMRDFLSFHDAHEITFENAGNLEFRTRLQKAF